MDTSSISDGIPTDAEVRATYMALCRLPVCKKVLPSGSRFTCDPAVMDTDVDFAILVDRLTDHKDFVDMGFTHMVDKEYKSGDGLTTYRKGMYNLIVMTTPRFKAFEIATTIAAGLNLLDKADRVFVFVTLEDALGNEPDAF